MASSAVRIGLYISLNQCSLSKGLEHRSAERDHLASDDPNAEADLAHLNPGSGCGPVAL
jgi:hypothetical protein